ncbi:MAG: CoA-binding protein, partial [Thermoplasmata archaeon]
KDAEGVESPHSREELIKKIDLTAIRRVIKDALNEGRVHLTTPEVQSILDSLKIPRPQSRIARGIDEAVEAAEAIGYPVVMKIVSRDIIHKSDVGGVALGLDNKKEVIDAYQAIIRNCRKFRPESRIEGVEVSRMITGGAETIVGGRRDRTFGPIVMFGLGGIHVEVIKDVTFRHFPFSRREALRMIREIKGFPILMGVRGEGMKDISTLADVILKVGALVYNITEIKDMEINPLVVFEQSEGVIALDARIFLSDKGGAGA